jgi:succinoglycan biosynthesis transport protein ExoP
MIKFQEISYDYQVSIRELWSNFWYNKIIFFIIVLLSIFVSILYSTNTRRVFQADSLFTLGEGERPLSFLNNLPIEMRGLAPLSGNNSSTTRAFIERLTSRKFILIIADDLKLYDDKFFNDQDVEAVDPKWKSWIKTLINWPLPPSDKTQVAKWNVVNSYSKSVSIDSTDAGAIEVRVQHSDPERAAEITNFIVKKSIDIIQTENYENSALRLKYLSSVLADALEDLEKTQTAMKNFSLNNSALSTQSFAAGSVLLDDLRSKRETSTEALKVINQLKIFNSKKLNSRDDYLLLRKKFPLLDQSSFRRMLGVSEVINAWSWPNLETLNQVQESVRDRIASLDSEIKKLENDALKYAESSTELAKLLRDTKVAEAAYQVLIEQVKSQSIVAGFAPNQSKIIAHAEIPLTPTRPNIILILALGTTLGSFLGIILSIVFGVVKGVYYSH